MINGKGIRILCCILMAIVYFFSFCLLVAGIVDIIHDEGAPAIKIIGCLLLPLITTVSLYPLFALSKIDDTLSEMNEKMDFLFNESNSIHHSPWKEEDDDFIID